MDLLPPFLFHQNGEFFAADTACTVHQHLFLFRDLFLGLFEPLRELIKIGDIGLDGAFEVPDSGFIVISHIDHNIILFLLHYPAPLRRRKIVARSEEHTSAPVTWPARMPSSA